MKKQTHFRAESERKEKITSIRLTEEQHQKIQERAKSKGMTFSNYMITASVNGDSALTPELLVKMQNVANEACAAVEEYAPEKVTLIQKGMAGLWQKSI